MTSMREALRLLEERGAVSKPHPQGANAPDNLVRNIEDSVAAAHHIVGEAISMEEDPHAAFDQRGSSIECGAGLNEPADLPLEGADQVPFESPETELPNVPAGNHQVLTNLQNPLPELFERTEHGPNDPHAFRATEATIDDENGTNRFTPEQMADLRKAAHRSPQENAATDAAASPHGRQAAPQPPLADDLHELPRMHLQKSGPHGMAASISDSSVPYERQLAQIGEDGQVSRPAPSAPVMPVTPTGIAIQSALANAANAAPPHVPLPSGNQPDPTPMQLPFDFFGGGTSALSPENILADAEVAQSMDRIAASRSQSAPVQPSAVAPASPAGPGSLPSPPLPSTAVRRSAAPSAPGIQSRPPNSPAASPQLPPATTHAPQLPLPTQNAPQTPPPPTRQAPQSRPKSPAAAERDELLARIQMNLKGRRLATEYHKIWTLIRQSARGGPTQGNVLFCDCEADRPAAQTLLYLAATPREGDTRSVLLLDADVQSSRLSSMVGMGNAAGFAEACNGAELEGLAQPIDLPFTYVLPAGISNGDIDPQGIPFVLSELSTGYDFIFMAGGVAQHNVVPSLRRACSKSFLVVRLGSANRNTAIDAVNFLESAEVKVNGCIVTNIEQDPNYFSQ